MTTPRKQIQTLRTRVQESDDITNADRRLLLAFSDELDLLNSEYSEHRHNKLLRHTTRIAENVGGLANTLEDREATKEIVRWINRQYTNEYTNHDYRTALRVFAKRVTGGDEPPDSVAWVPSGTSNSHNPVPNTEAQGYALAAIANGGEAHDIDVIQQMLEKLREEKQG